MADEPNPWRETVRELYDTLHFGPDNLFTGNPLAHRLIDLIEERHLYYFARMPEAGATDG